MRQVFVDTAYGVAAINPRDHPHEQARELEPLLEGVGLLTTEAILLELLNYFSASGAQMWRKAVLVIDQILDRTDVEVVWQP